MATAADTTVAPPPDRFGSMPATLRGYETTDEQAMNDLPRYVPDSQRDHESFGKGIRQAQQDQYDAEADTAIAKLDDPNFFNRSAGIDTNSALQLAQGYRKSVATNQLMSLSDSSDPNAASTASAGVGVGASKGAAALTKALHANVDSEGPYQQIKGEPGYQAHHLNQGAAYKYDIPSGDGFSINIKGDAMLEAGSPHFEAHLSLEQWWDQYRSGGDLFTQRPTNGEYGAALEKSLVDAGVDPLEAARLAAVAKQQRIDAGLNEDDPVPKIPRRFYQSPTSVVDTGIWNLRGVATGAKYAGRGLMIYGLYTDGSSIYNQYETSQSTGNYNNTYKEVARAGAGWTGAWAGAEAGASGGAVLGGSVGSVVPVVGTAIGAGVGGFVGGLAGGAYGYWQASHLVVKYWK